MLSTWRDLAVWAPSVASRLTVHTCMCRTCCIAAPTRPALSTPSASSKHPIERDTHDPYRAHPDRTWPYILLDSHALVKKPRKAQHANPCRKY
ncbi:hypothetical protein BV25DRAFT_325172 [Artomyces pyxidatus]|uniref:Uncharacterized protein n=1 Tax=Artomyces pyxidatus TaxID=48021 RepID=A0ACB8T756_9AGAM|nr:hypothetical protein BV25DRAFT_325172 [Artomyces pyxidatus]